jgi:hypothetical protein
VQFHFPISFGKFAAILRASSLVGSLAAGSPRLFLEINVGELLPGAVAHNEAGVQGGEKRRAAIKASRQKVNEHGDHDDPDQRASDRSAPAGGSLRPGPQHHQAEGVSPTPGCNRAKPPQARKARRPPATSCRGLLYVGSAKFDGSAARPSLASERIAGG